MAQYKSIVFLILILACPSYYDRAEATTSDTKTQDVQATSSGEDRDHMQIDASETSTLTANSYKIIANGWPATSPMWPTTQTASEQSTGNETTSWHKMVEPFIYADKPRSIDYSLLLAMNQTILDILKARLKPVAVNLSFEFYFNYDSKITAPPGIKIEVDRKQFKYLEPTGSIIPRIWSKFNEQVTINDAMQFQNHDWLKFSLVNRQSPSLVAIRKLKVEFLTADSESQKVIATTTTSTTTPSTIQQEQTVNPVTQDKQPEQIPAVPASQQNVQNNQVTEPVVDVPKPQTTARIESPKEPNNANQIDQNANQQATYPAGNNEPQDPSNSNVEPTAAASDILETKIRPVESKKKKGWSIWGNQRRKRDVNEQQVGNSTSKNIVLTCFQSHECDWKADGNEEIQWSLARMPPSTDIVKTGYYYVSNRNKYGDSTKLLSLSLNQTESATIADQNSDHCVELALYVTERTYLKLYRLIRNVEVDSSWNKGSLLMVWSPTMATQSNSTDNKLLWRNSLPKSKLLAMENGRNGWTTETLCFGDFFSNLKECNLGKCAFGFEMEGESQQHVEGQQSGQQDKTTQEEETSGTNENKISNSPLEQVVGISLTREFTTNIPAKLNHPKWLEIWERDEIEPIDNWKFYPNLDYEVGRNNVSLRNLYDNAHYYMESEWLEVENHLDFKATLAIKLNDDDKNSSQTSLTKDLVDFPNSIDQLSETTSSSASHDQTIVSLKLITRLVDSSFHDIYSNSTILDVNLRNNVTRTLFNLNLPLTDEIVSARHGQLKPDNGDNLFKIILEFIIDCHSLSSDYESLLSNSSDVKLSIANVSLSDRCYPNPCQYGNCQQNGTGFEDWNCQCDDRHRGRRCEFGRWCNIPHITPWIPQSANNGKVTIKTPNQQQRQPKLAIESVTRVSGKEYCQRKLGSGSKCTDIDLALNENLYTEEDKTFICSCQDDFYLSDDSKCKQAHLCNSIVCPSIGMFCDENKPFNRTQPCHCNEKQDWFPDPLDPTKCTRKQCHDKQRECQFDAHICLPTLPGERPICKCGPKFTLKTNEKGQKYCQSTACILPTLNDCQQICLPDNSNLQHPYTCACHPGYSLGSDGKSCHIQRPNMPPYCKPACQSDTQICTDTGCKCKQGYVGEGEVVIQQAVKNRQVTNSTASHINYVKSIRCLNVCSLSYAENKEEFEKIESVCPLGLCNPTDFQCRCADPSSSALVNTKYEPIYGNETDSTGVKIRTSPLCHLRRVCDPESSSYKICRSQGAICVPDYTKAAMFDCICPPSTEKKLYGQGTNSEFTCEPKCSTKGKDCLRRQAICKLVDRDQVKCDCLPGLMFDQHDHKCYLAKYSYAFNLVVVNRYYEPESKFHRVESVNGTSETTTSLHESEDQDSNHKTRQDSGDNTELNLIVPQYNRATTKQTTRSIFITEYNQCNITQVIPKTVIEDPYEHDVESFLGYIEQCNEKIHQNVRTYHLNSRLSEDLRQSLRQHIRDFTVTTSNSSCIETDTSGMYLNCTIYLQSNEPVPKSTISYIFGDCDTHGQNEKFCWVKPRLLLKKLSSQRQITKRDDQQVSSNITSTSVINDINFHQIIPCEINNFCGVDALSVRSDDETSLCSCKCPPDIEVIDVRDLEPRRQEAEDSTKPIPIKEVCAPRNHCGSNSTFCLYKVGSVCQYDLRLGSKCLCVYPSYEGSDGRCVEVTFSQLDNTLIVIVILLGTGFVVSVAINLAALAKAKSVFGRSKQYPMNEFSTHRAHSRSTGVPNLAFTND